uniref:Nucleotide-diphospho-sugar transferase domain-containing protein n=1 Tax=viral metagenome TaxID=1070528 RepID=A0A6C0B0B7_9ZZZZ
MNAIVFFCFRPLKRIFDFAKLLKNSDYDIFVSINDNSYILPDYDNSAITVIKLDDNQVGNAGYFNSNNNMRYKVCSRDKAFYYFNRISNTNYKHIWFIEEDVFIPTTKTISDIDSKYPEGDFMSNSYFIVDNDINNLNNFANINKQAPFIQYDKTNKFYQSWAFEDLHFKDFLQFPWLKGMTCAIRVSMNFLKMIDIFASKYKILLMDEVLYPTLSLHNNLSIVNPVELSSIVFTRDFNKDDIIRNNFYWNYDDIRPDYLFHPIKDLDLQVFLRKTYNFT